MPLHMPTWAQTKTSGKAGFDKVYTVVDKLGAPINRLSNKVGAEAFWPTTLDKESDKAARILKSFCKDGFYVAEDNESVKDGQKDGEAEEKENEAVVEGKPKGKQRVLKKIPTEVIKNAKGLAIFTTMRTGLWISGAGGSGILIARKEDGSWSPPSGILLHTAGLGFLIGVDIYDCVVVINTQKALEAFTKIRCTLGGEVSATAGPVGMGGVMEADLRKAQPPVWNYLKSRGFYAGVQIDGTVIIQRQDENARFYGEPREVDQILRGEVKRVPPETRTLLATIQSAQGDEVDESLLPSAEPTPGDLEVQVDEAKNFGLPPSEDDPDPYGVKALEEEGMIIKEIKDTGEKSRPSLEAFEYKPSPSSPIFNNYRDSMYKRHSRRTSRDTGKLSISSVDRGTQTEPVIDSPRFIESPRDSGHHSPIKKTTENLAEEPEPAENDDSTHEDKTQTHTEEPVIIEKAKVVTIPRRVPPPLPARNPGRSSQLSSPTGTFPLSPITSESRGLAGLGIDQQPAGETGSSQQAATAGAGLSSPDPETKMDGIHLTASQDAALTEELTHIHLSPRQQQDQQRQDRLSPSRNPTNSSDVHETGSVRSITSSNYSGVESPPDTSTVTTHQAGIAPVNAGAEKVDEAEETKFGSAAAPRDGTSSSSPEIHGKEKGDEFHSIPGTPTEGSGFTNVDLGGKKQASAADRKEDDFS